jgi:hypothetical protein
MKLSKAQEQLLAVICQAPAYVSDYYRPALKLVAMGLCEWRRTRLHPTEKGKAVNAADNQQPESEVKRGTRSIAE